MFEKYFNRTYEKAQIPCFAPEQSTYEWTEYAQNMEKQHWVRNNWQNYFSKNGAVRYINQAKRIAAYGGLILEIAAGPGGGFTPYILSENYEAYIMISDLCHTVPAEWKKLFDSMETPPPNVEYAVIDARSLPFLDNSLDVICGCPAIAEVRDNKQKVLQEIYRALKPGGLFVFQHTYIRNESLSTKAFQSLDDNVKKAFLEQWAESFFDYTEELSALGYSIVDTEMGGAGIVDSDSELGAIADAWGVKFTMQGFVKYCVK